MSSRIDENDPAKSKILSEESGFYGNTQNDKYRGGKTGGSPGFLA
jgi:hypothetical protein